MLIVVVVVVVVEGCRLIGPVENWPRMSGLGVSKGEEGRRREVVPSSSSRSSSSASALG